MADPFGWKARYLGLAFWLLLAASLVAAGVRAIIMFLLRAAEP